MCIVSVGTNRTREKKTEEEGRTGSVGLTLQKSGDVGSFFLFTN
jgi:hypothetical protein